MVVNSLAKARGLSLRTGTQSMFYLSQKPNTHNYTHYVQSGVNLKSYMKAIGQTENKQRLLERKSKTGNSKEGKGNIYSRTSMARTPLKP